MKIAEIMTSEVEFIDPSDSVRAAAEMMGELDVGALPVGTAEDMVGVVTDRDILYRVVAAGRSPADVAVRDVMSAPVVGCDPDDELAVVLDAMAAHHVRRMPARDGAMRVVGWVTLSDIARRLLLDDGGLQDFLRTMTDPSEASAVESPAEDATPRSDD